MSRHRRPEGAFGDVRLFAAAFKRRFEKPAHETFFKSGSEQPHSKGLFLLTNWPAWTIKQLTGFGR